MTPQIWWQSHSFIHLTVHPVQCNVFPWIHCRGIVGRRTCSGLAHMLPTAICLCAQGFSLSSWGSAGLQAHKWSPKGQSSCISLRLPLNTEGGPGIKGLPWSPVLGFSRRHRWANNGFPSKLPCGLLTDYPHLSPEPSEQQMATCQLLKSWPTSPENSARESFTVKRKSLNSTQPREWKVFSWGGWVHCGFPPLQLPNECIWQLAVPASEGSQRKPDLGGLFLPGRGFPGVWGIYNCHLSVPLQCCTEGHVQWQAADSFAGGWLFCLPAGGCCCVPGLGEDCWEAGENGSCPNEGGFSAELHAAHGAGDGAVHEGEWSPAEILSPSCFPIRCCFLLILATR